MRFRFGLIVLLAWASGDWIRVHAADWPDYQEVIQVIKDRLPRLQTNEINQAVMLGLQQQLATRFSFITDPLKQITEPLPSSLAQHAILDAAYGYFRIVRVDKSLAKSLEATLQRIHATNAFKGIILDLRYASGSEYSSIGQIASLFIEGETSLFSCRGDTVKSHAGTNAWKAPAAILVNHQTKEAAEVLAAVLRNHNVGLVLGTNTAGCAWVYQELPLKNGQRIRLATDQVLFESGQAVPDGGLIPDILVAVSPEDERAYYADVFRQVAQPSLLAEAHTNRVPLLAGTNRSSRRLNEAELVRRQKEGSLTNDEEEAGINRDRESDAERPTVTDPSLARALDLLKGLSVVQKSRPATFNR